LASVSEIRELCLEELRKCEQASTPAELRRHAVRAMNFARLASRMQARVPKDQQEPPPPDFVAALSGILGRLKETLELTLPDAKSPPSD